MIQRIVFSLCAMLASVVCIADETALLDAMTRVLEGRMDEAVRLVNALDRLDPESPAALLDIELADMQRGGYATEGNRSFPELAPLWQQARAAFVERHTIDDGLLPDAVLQVPNNVSELVAVDLGRHVAYRLHRDARSGWGVRDAYYVSSGRAGHGKRRRGDRRTPLGVYFPLDALDTQKLPERYGARAITLDYPNALDRAQGRTGDGIWLHGINRDNNVRPPRDTDGCVAFDNDRIVELSGALSLSHTPVVLSSGLRWRAVDDRPPELATLRAAVSAWSEAWQQANAQAFVGFYPPGYTRFGGSAERWRAQTAAAIAAADFSRVAVEELAIFRADDESSVYLSRFFLRLQRGSDSVRVLRRIYWRNGPAGWEIVAEQGH
ncbi:MAG: L,D-transpeptidase family protein [Pseudomonadota bacterium]